MNRDLRVAAVQMNSSNDRDANLEQAEQLIRRAVRDGAEFVALPENFAVMATEGVVIREVETVEGPTLAWASSLAREHGIDILLGSIPERSEREGMRRNTSLLVARDGKLAAVYRKVHLFDVDLESGSLRESSVVEAGDRLVWGDLEWGRVGLTVCYDLRFPEMYRALTLGGADVLTCPAAFTAQTGPHHWHLLLRARAVENQRFVVAPAQVGRHGKTRASYGHALVIDPWGEVLADAAGEQPGMAVATITKEQRAAAERRIPCLSHLQQWLNQGETVRPTDEDRDAAAH